MTTKSLLRPKEEGKSSIHSRKADFDKQERDDFDETDSAEDVWDHDTESTESGEIYDDKLKRFCLDRFKKCLYDKTDSPTESDGSYVPHALKKLMKKIKAKQSVHFRKKSKLRLKTRRENSSGVKNGNKLSKSATDGFKPEQHVAITIPSNRKSVPYKEETAIQKSAASNVSNKDHLRRQETTNSKSRKSLDDVSLDPTNIQKEAERMVAQMHNQGKITRVNELEGYLDDVKRAIRVLDIAEGDDDDDIIDLSPDSEDEDEEDPSKMDAQTMRTMLTSLAGREAKEDTVASVANVGPSWRTVPHDKLNCCLSMDPKMMSIHRQRVKKNYEEFDKIFRPRKEGNAKRTHLTEEDNEEPFKVISEKPKDEASRYDLMEEEPVNIADLTREEMLEIHDKIGPWVHHHTNKLDKFIASKKYTPQYLLNHWNGELSDDDSEVDFEKYRFAWKKKLEDRENPDENAENQPPPIQPEERVPTLPENNWFLFPTPMTRSYSTDTDELGWDGQRSRPFSQVAMEGLVKNLKRQREAEKTKKFLKEHPWPPPMRYPPEMKTETDLKHLGRDVIDEEEDDISRGKLN